MNPLPPPTTSVAFHGQFHEAELEKALATTMQGSTRLLRYGMILLLFGYAVWEVVASHVFILLGFATLVLYIGILSRQPLEQRYRHIFRTDKRNQVPISGVVTPHGFEIQGAGFSHFVPWEVRGQYRLSDDMVIFYRPGGSITGYPRTHFQTEQEWLTFQSLVKAYGSELTQSHTYQPQ